MAEILDRLGEILEARKGADPQTSYVASLYRKGQDAILRKISEEATETILAAKQGDREQIVCETADLWFHTLVLLASEDLRPDDVCRELERRFGVSGIEEKAGRGG
jgi:phosphoribosyl-ATP pyrophosphohydrolase